MHIEDEIKKIIESYYNSEINKEDFLEKIENLGRGIEENIEVEEIIIELDLNKSLSENAEEYYKKAKKINNLIKSEKLKLKLLLEKLDSLKKGLLEEEKRKKELEALEKLIKKGKWYEKFRYFISSEGELVVCGKDASTNEILIKKYSKDFKWVLHSEAPGSPFCLTNGGIKTLEEAADFIASFSKAWKTGISSTDVFYVKPEQVSKKTESREYISKGSFIIRGEKNYLKGVAKYSIGIKIDKEKKEIKDILFGPYKTVKEKADFWITLVPGRKKSKEIAKYISQKFKIKYWQIFLNLIPPGGAEISKSESKLP